MVKTRCTRWACKYGQCGDVDIEETVTFQPFRCVKGPWTEGLLYNCVETVLVRPWRLATRINNCGTQLEEPWNQMHCHKAGTRPGSECPFWLCACIENRFSFSLSTKRDDDSSRAPASRCNRVLVVRRKYEEKEKKKNPKGNIEWISP